MAAFNFTKTADIGGVTFLQPLKTLTGPGVELVDPQNGIPIAWTGTLSTRTNNNTGTITMADAGHLITTGSRVDVYWDVAGVKGVQRACTVGTVAGTSVPISLGVGDNLPPQSSTVQVCIAVETAFSFAGSNLVALALGGEGRCTIVVASGSVTEELFKVFTEAGCYIWTNLDSETNPVVGDTITKVFMSHNNTLTPVKVRAAALKSA